MTRVVILVDSESADLEAALTALNLAGIRCVQEFRAMADSLPLFEPRMHFSQPPARKFGSDRPYLKKKKGRS